MYHFTATERFFMFVPETWIGLFIFLILALSVWIGALIRSGWMRSFGKSEHDETQEGYVVSAASGLLALLLGFTFAMAIDRFDARRQLVIEEANAISTTYLLAQTFAEPDRTRLSNILVAYVDNRLAAGRGGNPGRTVQLLDQGRELKVRLWAAALAATRNVRDDIASSFLQSAAETLAVGSARETARLGRIPPRIHLVLLLFTAITTMVLGFAFVGPTRHFAIGTLLILLTFSLLLIIDLDRPTAGAIREPQWAMEDLKLRLREAPPSRYAQLKRG